MHHSQLGGTNTPQLRGNTPRGRQMQRHAPVPGYNVHQRPGLNVANITDDRVVPPVLRLREVTIRRHAASAACAELHDVRAGWRRLKGCFANPEVVLRLHEEPPHSGQGVEECHWCE